jgi:hypothetical protein
MENLSREKILVMPADREMDILIAEKIMGLKVVARNHPCGCDPECGDYEASSFIPPIGGWYDTEDVVYLPEYGIYPPIAEPMMGDSYCIVNIVPFYSINISAAWQVVEKFVEQGDKFHIFRYGNWNKKESKKCWQSYMGKAEYNLFPFASADTAPLAICRAALLAVSEEK